MNDNASAFAIAKQLSYDCEGSGDITLPKGTLKIVLDAYMSLWQTSQVNTRATYKKVSA